MDRNTGIGILLLVALWGLLMWYNQSQQEDVPPAQTQASATDTARSQNRVTPLADTATLISADTVQTADSTRQKERLGGFSAFASGSEQLITVENATSIYTFSNKGGILQKVVLKGYTTHDSMPLVIFDAGKKNLGINFVTNSPNGTININTDELYFSTLSKSIVLSENSQPANITFFVELGDGKRYEHRYSVPAKGNLVDYTVAMQGFDELIPRNVSYLTLDWHQQLPSQEGNITDERNYSNIYYRASNKEVDKLGARKDDEKKLTSGINWLSFKQKFFNSTLIASKNFEGGTKISSKQDPEDKYVKEMKAQLVIPFSGSADFSFPMQFYFGPNKYKELRAAKIDLDEIIPLGWGIFGWINKFIIIPIFNFLGRFIGNYGVIIFLLTIIIKLITGPFTYKSYLSMIKMKVLKPELDELRAKYGKKQQEFAAKQMELFRKAGVSPLGGCLPMLLQMPILLAMYNFFPSSIELRQEHFLWAKDLSHYDSVLDLPFKIPAYGDHVSLFAILMAISSFAYTKMNASSQPSMSSGGGGAEDMMAAQMKIFTYIMPVMLLFIFNSSSAALSYYYFLFNITSMVQQWGMKKFMIDEAKIHAQIQQNKAKPMKKSSFQAKLEDMMKAQQEAQRQRQRKK